MVASRLTKNLKLKTENLLRHGRTKRKFGRTTKKRNALMRDLVLALIHNGRIITTEARAKSLKIVAEKLITSGRTQTVSARRQLVSRIGDAGARKVASEVSPRFTDRAGGYTRIIKMPPRISDGAKMALIELVD